MKTLFVFASFSMASILCSYGQSNGGNLGVGAMLGEPTGISLKYWLDATHAIDGGVAWSLTENESLHLHADYLFHVNDALSPKDLKGPLSFYYGIGARLKFKDGGGKGRNADDDLVGIRFPLGLSYRIPESPFDVFLEFVPVLDVVPSTDVAFDLAVGGRYYF